MMVMISRKATLGMNHRMDKTVVKVGVINKPNSAEKFVKGKSPKEDDIQRSRCVWKQAIPNSSSVGRKK